MFGSSNKILRILSLLKTAFHQYAWQIFFMIVLNFLSGILEGIGINAIIPLFSFIEGGSAGDTISLVIAGFFGFFHLTYSVRYLLIFILVLFIIKAFALFFSKYITLKITTDYEQSAAEDLFRTTLNGSWPYLSRQRIGYLDQVITNDIKGASTLLTHIGGIVLIIANLVVYGVVAINISFMIATLALISGGLIFYIFKPFFYKNRIASSEIARQYKELAHYINESIIGIKGIKSMAAESTVFRRGIDYFRRMKDLKMRVGFATNVSAVALQPIGLFFIVGIFAFFYKTAVFNFASFAVIVYSINRIFSNAQLIQAETHVMSAYLPNVTSILRYREEASAHRERDRGKKHFSFKKRLEFNNVSFSYDDVEKGIANASFFVKKGDMVGLIGPSGAGKTTVVDLLLRFLDPREGVITLDGENIADIFMKEWRKNISYVSQEIFLVNDTIEENIRFYDHAISREEIVEAARTANIYDFIQNQPKQFETVVGERGTRLSGGERQRVILARALVRNPQILILDEATSALDNESEFLIQKAIEKLRGKITVIAIAHRLSTVVDSDKLIVLENGRIIEQGVPPDLLKDKESYFFRTYHLKK